MKKKVASKKEKRARITIIFLALLVAILHIPELSKYPEPVDNFNTSYLIDILLPFVIFLLTFTFRSKLFSIPVRAVFIFTACCFVELLQWSGYPIFGSTYDHFDFLAYLGGIFLGIAFELGILNRITDMKYAFE